MRDVVDMWSNTRMVVLTAISASLYAAILIPFKVLPIIPGVTELRPANAVPVVCSFLFGPAGAWGAAIGNVIGDFFGGLGPGDFFGFLGNFLYGFIPYKAWMALTDAAPVPSPEASLGRRVAHFATLAAVIFFASGACALVVGWGLNLLGFVPFSVLGNIILVNNFAVAATLTPLLLWSIFPRVHRAGLTHGEVMPRPSSSRPVRLLGLGMVAVAVIGGLVLGNLLSTGSVAPWLAGLPATPTRAFEVGVGLLPVLALLIVGLALL